MDLAAKPLRWWDAAHRSSRGCCDWPSLNSAAHAISLTHLRLMSGLVSKLQILLVILCTTST